MKKLIATAVMTALVTGCATTKSIKYPTAGQQTALSVSSEQMSSMTEAVAGDYFIKDSQIMVGDISNLSSSQASSMFGLVGLGVAIAIDKTKNGSAIEKSTLNKPIKFDQETEQCGIVGLICVFLGIYPLVISKFHSQVC